MKKKLAVIAVVFVLVIGGVIALFLARGAGDRTVGAWRVAGDVRVERETPDGVRLQAGGDAVLDRAGITVLVPAGTTVLVPAAAAGGAPEVPAVIAGSVRVIAAAPFVLRGEPAEPREPVELSIDRDGADVVRGTIEILGRTFTPGMRVPLGPPPAEEPGAAREDGRPPAPAPAEVPPIARVVEARTGAPMPGVDVIATFSYGEDGDPPLPGEGSQVAARTDGAGFLRLPPFRPEDPRVKLHLQASRPGYLPEALVVESEREPDGAWPMVTIALRSAFTCRVVFLEPDGSPLAGAAVEVRDRPADPYPGEDSWDEGCVRRPRASPVRYTAADGSLLAWQQPATFALRHPSLHILVVRDMAAADPTANIGGFPASSCALDLRPPADRRPVPDPRATVGTAAAETREYRLEDRDKLPVADSLIEVRLDGLPPVRLHTGPAGEFSFGPRPFAPGESDRPLSFENPRRGTVLVLSPLLAGVVVPIALPSRAPIFVADGRLGGTLAARVVEPAGEEDGEVRAVPVEDIRILGTRSPLTLVRRTAAGEVAWEGHLPSGGTEIELILRGYLPAAVGVPPHVAGAATVDLGEVALDPGWTFPLEVVRGEGAVGPVRFSLADRDRPELAQEYRVAEGEATIGGIVPGRTYRWAVDGSRIRRVEGQVFADQPLVDDGLSVSLDASDEVEVAVSGSVGGLRPEETLDYRAIERCVFGDSPEPRAFASYPLAPDGLLGSRRLLLAPRRAEVLVAGPGDRAGFAARDFPPDDFRMDFGRIELRDFPRATFRFRVKGLGPVAPPADAALVAEEERNHELARLRSDDTVLRVEHLRPGGYVLRWGEADGAEVHRFRVRADDVDAGGELLRRPLEKERISLRVVDPEGKPTDGAQVTVDREGAPPARPLSGGFFVVEVLPAAENRIRIEREGSLPAELVVGPGAGVPDPIALRRGARARARVIDADRLPFDGDLVVSPSPADEEARAEGEARVVHGGPFATRVARGALDDRRFPPGLQRIEFRAASSPAKVVREFAIADGRPNDLGTISLAETRTVTGTVAFPSGDPAPGAVVSLVKAGAFRRFPGKDPDPRAVLGSAKAGPLGRFRIDGLPLDLPKDAALAAHLAGWTDAVESPVDPDAGEHELALAEPVRLVIDAGYSDAAGFDDFEFRLRWLPAPDSADSVEVGPVAPGPPGGTAHEGIEPGVYRLQWGLRESHPAFIPRKAEVAVGPGESARLVLRIVERAIGGEAVLNGSPLALGWVILLEDPARPDDIRVGRVRDGRFAVPVAFRGDAAWASLIPERDPLPWPRFSRGEALPAPVPDFRAGVRRRFISVRYAAHDFVLEVPAWFQRANPIAEIEFPHYEAGPGGFRKGPQTEAFGGSPFRLSLLPHGRFSFRVAWRGGSRVFPDIELSEDVRIVLE